MKFHRNFTIPVIPASKLGWKQEGGAMVPSEEPAAADAQDPMAEVLQMAMQAVEAQDPQMAMQVCTMLVEMANAQAPEAMDGGELDKMMDGGNMNDPQGNMMGYGGVPDV